MKIYQFSARTIDGADLDFQKLKGRVLLIVNVASQCGFTSQYQGLEELYRKYYGQGLTILGFPCNQFGAQEPGEETEIKAFCDTRFGVTFPLFSKIEVNGPHAHPLYEFLKSQAKGILGSESIKWNFTKFLVDRQGNVVGRYAPTTTPEQLEVEIKKWIDRPARIEGEIKNGALL